MSKKLLVSLLFIACLSESLAKKKSIDFNHAKVAVEINIQDLAEQVRFGITVFGDYKSGLKATDYKMPEYLTEHIEAIFSALDFSYEFVERTDLSASDGLKKKALRKLRKKHYDEFLIGLRNQNFTDLLTFNFLTQKVSNNRKSMPAISGYGVYKIPGSNCIYQTLGYFHTGLMGQQKPSVHAVVQEIPEKSKMDHFCQFGIDAKKLGLQWQKDASKYSASDQALIEKALKDLVLDALIDTFQRHGIIETQIQANQLFIQLTQSDYQVVEKVNSDQFKIGVRNYNKIELMVHLQQLVEQGQRVKVLLGLETKSNYTFGDIKDVFSPVVKNTQIKLFRLGPNYEIIDI